MRRLSVISALILLLLGGNFLDQNPTIDKPILIAKARSSHPSRTAFINRADIANDEPDIETQTVNQRDWKNTARYSPSDGKATQAYSSSKDISLLIKEELNLQKKLGLEYKSAKINFRRIPLFLSSKDDNTRGAVLPPFVYFKQKF